MDGQMDRQTSCHGIVRAMHTRRAVKFVCLKCSGGLPLLVPDALLDAHQQREYKYLLNSLHSRALRIAYN